MKTFRGKAAVVTGAGGGIGRALALGLAKHGCRVAVADINPEAAEATAEACRALGVDSRSYAFDVADRHAMEAFAAQVERDFGGANLVINNAGVALVSAVRDMSWENFEWLMGIDFWGVAYGCRYFLPQLIASGDGHLVNISSIAGMVSFPYSSAYNAAKFAVRGYTESLAQEIHIDKLPVQVSCVHPGVIKTNILRAARQERAEKARGMPDLFDKLARTTPERAAERIIKGILRNEKRIFVGADAVLMDSAQRCLGTGYQALNQAITRLMLSKEAKV